ncbi:hypothetical protein [Magnetococcus sp. PR-3]|uniref:hypothetical protein n=1 Tax=Magnetococcus sp. PR-3 TaxID=3120355 RepID=UPI002FCE5DC3
MIKRPSFKGGLIRCLKGRRCRLTAFLMRDRDFAHQGHKPAQQAWRYDQATQL